MNYLKNYLSRISDFEETFEKEYLIYKKKSGLFSKYENEIISNAMGMVNELEELLHLHNGSSQFIRQNIINPIEKIIKVQSSLNSSIRISIKKIAISFQKAEENHGLTNNTTLCLSPSPSPIKFFSPNSPNKDKFSLKTVKNKEISVLIKDHISRELIYLSSIKTILCYLYDDALIFNKNIQELHNKILNTSKSVLSNQSIDKEKNEENLRLLKEHGRNDYILKNNENNSSEEDELERRFNIKEKEPLIATYLCAYADKILLQGKLYITASFLYFFSHFNSFTILGKDTIVTIKISDIQLIKKKKNVLIFDNSILVKTHTTNYFFTSFISRDEAFSIILRLLSINIKKTLPIQPIPEFFVENRGHMLELSSKLKEIKNPFANMFPSSYFTHPAFNPALSLNITIHEAYSLIFSDESQGFMKEFLESSGNTNISVANWSKAPPDYFLNNDKNS